MQPDEWKSEAMNRFSRNFHTQEDSRQAGFLVSRPGRLTAAACFLDGALGLAAAKLGQGPLWLEEALFTFTWSYLAFGFWCLIFICFLLLRFCFDLFRQVRKFCIPDGSICGTDLLLSVHKRPLPFTLSLRLSSCPHPQHPQACTFPVLTPCLDFIRIISYILDLGGGSGTHPYAMTTSCHLTSWRL